MRRLSMMLALALGTAPLSGQTGLLVVAHGADSSWNQRVREVMAEVTWDGPMRVAFLMGPEAATASWDAAITGLLADGADSLVVVPLMVSTHGSHVRQIEHYAGLRADLPPELARMGHAHHAAARPSVPVRVTTALDAAPELGEALAARWSALPGTDRARPLVLVAHGPTAAEDVEPWITGIRRATAPLERALRGRPLHVGLLRDDAPPEIRAAAVAGLRDTITTLAAAHGDSVTVMTVLISSGQINRVKVPQDLDGMPMRYVGAALAPHPAIARWIERVAAGR
jgi:sirohydrochlorin ferrochelatase